MLTWLRVIWARICAFLNPRELDREFEEELAAHLAMAEEEKIRQGLSQREARRKARVELGGLTQLREAGREARGLPWLDTFWLDIKLSFRLLRKSWGLTLVGGLAMTIAISIGVVIFWFFEMALLPTLPLDEGDRVVAIQNWDEKASQRLDTWVPDFEHWHDTLRSVEDFGAFQTIQRGLSIANGPAEPVAVAEMTASGFQLARIPPLVGRPLIETDELDSAPPVVVISYDIWQTRFAADPTAVGQVIRLGGTDHTVVGVMPEGFAFPMNHHFWTPLRLAGADYLRDAGPEGVVFARLASGVTLSRAQVELTALGLQSPDAVVDGELRVRPRVVPYTFAFTGDFEHGEIPWVVRLMLMLAIILLIPPCANIAILVYARTIARQEELASRFALGASRSRIVGQLFIEVFVLALAAASVALVMASLAGMYVRDMISRKLDGAPFWFDFTISWRTVLFAAGLALVAAMIAGMVPALKATGRQVQSGFQGLGSRTGMQLGGTWTVLVVAQVAVTLAALPAAVEMGWGTVRNGVLGPGFAAENFLTARLVVDQEVLANNQTIDDDRSFASRTAALQAEVVQQLETEAGVLGVTTALAVPGREPWAKVEVENVQQLNEQQLSEQQLSEQQLNDSVLETFRIVRFNQVDPAFFDVFDIPLLIGRNFDRDDFAPARNAVVVNQTFAQQLLGDTNPLGHRVRYSSLLDGAPTVAPATAPATEVWYEIVGVVADRPAHATRGTMYHPAVPGQVEPISLGLSVGISPASLTDRLRQITTALDPALRTEEVFPLDEIYHQQQVANNVGALALAVVTVAVLLLSAAGMYALMSFTVNQRRREIGIRAALGAHPIRLLAGIFRRSLGQVGIGAAIGAVIALLLDFYLPIEQAGGWNVPGAIPGAALFMIVVGLLAAAGPARRGLRVDPIEELREG